MVEQAEEYRNILIEAVAENDEVLMEKHLEGEEITREELKVAIRKETIANTLVPVVCGSSYKNRGVQKPLDAIVDYMPALPMSRTSRVWNPETEEQETRPSSDDAPFGSSGLQDRKPIRSLVSWPTRVYPAKSRLVLLSTTP